MIVGNIKDLQGIEVTHPSAKESLMKVLVGANEGWGDYVMRVVEVQPGGYTPQHSHPWPHINYMIEGKGEVHIDGTDYPVEAGSFSFVPGDKIHQFRNKGDKVFKFICIVPKEGHK